MRYKFKLPVVVYTSPKKKVYLNLNVYRNLHYMTNNAVKKAFNDLMMEFLYGKEFVTPLKLSYTLHRNSKRKGDRANVICIVDKFFCDAMVNYGCIEDDTDEHIFSQESFTGGNVEGDSYVEVIVTTNL